MVALLNAGDTPSGNTNGTKEENNVSLRCLGFILAMWNIMGQCTIWKQGELNR